jgi:hypothetical protein
LNKKQKNMQPLLQQTLPEGKRQGAVELTDADLEQIQGGKGTCSTGKHISEVKTTV